MIYRSLAINYILLRPELKKTGIFSNFTVNCVNNISKSQTFKCTTYWKAFNSIRQGGSTFSRLHYIEQTLKL